MLRWIVGLQNLTRHDPARSLFAGRHHDHPTHHVGERLSVLANNCVQRPIRHFASRSGGARFGKVAGIPPAAALPDRIAAEPPVKSSGCRITGIALGWIGATSGFGSHVRNTNTLPTGDGLQIPANADDDALLTSNQTSARPALGLGSANAVNGSRQRCSALVSIAHRQRLALRPNVAGVAGRRLVPTDIFLPRGQIFGMAAEVVAHGVIRSRMGRSYKDRLPRIQQPCR